jgi:hypothetical protein
MRGISHVIITIAFLTGGCGDPAQGTATSAKLQTLPDLSCLDAALRKEIGSEWVSPMKLDRWQDQATYSWEYGGALKATLQIKETAEGIRYLNTNVRMGRDATQAQVFDPEMRRVNAAISRDCNVTLLDASYGTDG